MLGLILAIPRAGQGPVGGKLGGSAHIPLPGKKRSGINQVGQRALQSRRVHCGAVKKMRLPVPPGARLLQGLLGLTLLLLAVCGMQEKPQSPGAQPRNLLQKEQGIIETGKSQQQEGMAMDDSTPVTPSSLSPKKTLGSSLQDGHKVVRVSRDETAALGVAEKSEPEHGDAQQEEDDVQENLGMSSGEQQGREYVIPFVSDISDLYGCEPSVSCRSVLLILYVNFLEQELPSCPCTYLFEAKQGVVSLFDQHVRSNVTWRDASSPGELPDKSSASYCLRSVLSDDGNVMASQHCCYDAKGLLLTRGNGVGTPDLISPDFSPLLHAKLNSKLWSQCKDEWPRHRAVLPPNNGLLCPDNPSQDQDLN